MLSLVEKKEEKNDSFPDPPDELGYDAKCVWMETGNFWFDKGLLDDGNLNLFRSYCVLIGESLECEAMIGVDGKIVGGKKHPAWDMMLNAIKEAKNLYVILNPKKIKPEGDEEEDDTNWKGLLA